MDNLEYQIKIIGQSVEEAGSASELARILGSSKQCLHSWKKGVHTMPEKYCVKLAKKYNFVDITKLSKILDQETIEWIKNKK